MFLCQWGDWNNRGPYLLGTVIAPNPPVKDHAVNVHNLSILPDVRIWSGQAIISDHISISFLVYPRDCWFASGSDEYGVHDLFR